MDYMGERWWLFSDSLLLHEGSRSSSYLSAREPSKVSGRWVGGREGRGEDGSKGGRKVAPQESRNEKGCWPETGGNVGCLNTHRQDEMCRWFS
jgi:hypothetical protein